MHRWWRVTSPSLVGGRGTGGLGVRNGAQSALSSAVGLNNIIVEQLTFDNLQQRELIHRLTMFDSGQVYKNP